jgi:hypothetical protein
MPKGVENPYNSFISSNMQISSKDVASGLQGRKAARKYRLRIFSVPEPLWPF